MVKYERLFERKENIKYKIDDYIRLIELDNPDVFYLARILNINEELEKPNYFIETFDKKSNSIIIFWLFDDEILKKANSKEKSIYIKKRNSK